ncbi:MULTISPECIES: MFS transporter [unclassified Paenibacillus]|uniref:MFS transporter n=1 Tax=unclassified Paenibacillus TaxID=185978 RepID=UPI000953DC4B|nr:MULTISPECIES: MFS transporter [unclassified Paenibacillus]ASS67896.2 MFS transporter [Paenibacillus sp. RUD330]SIR44682.1 Nitrate/nitrite transporter NarK [Paenibacillus sp. RU4X]SIR54373.1 Nitrate/nitrite transporter NarK [Paenibacillus sp. RU4T]
MKNPDSSSARPKGTDSAASVAATASVSDKAGWKGKSRWSVIAAYSLLAAATQLLWVTYTPITTASAAAWGVSVDAVGWLAQVFPLLYIVLALPFGYWADRRFKHSLAAGALATAAGALLRLVPGYSWALAGQIVVSIGQPLVLNAVNKLAGLYAEPSKRSAAIAAGTASLFVGILVSTVSAPWLLEWGGLSSVHRVQAAIAVAAGGAMLWALRIPALYSETAVPASAFAAVRSVWSQPWVRLYGLILFAGFGMFVTITTWLEVLSLPVGIGSKEVGIGIGAMTLAGILGAALLPGWASSGSRARLTLLASLLMSAAALAALAWGPPLWLFIVLFAAAGFLLLASLPVILSSAESRAPLNEAGTIAGLLLLFGNLGGVVLTVAAQLLLGRRLAAIGLLIAVVLLALPVAWRFPRGADGAQAASPDASSSGGS